MTEEVTLWDTVVFIWSMLAGILVGWGYSFIVPLKEKKPTPIPAAAPRMAGLTPEQEQKYKGLTKEMLHAAFVAYMQLHYPVRKPEAKKPVVRVQRIRKRCLKCGHSSVILRRVSK